MSLGVNPDVEGDRGALARAYRRAERVPLVERKRAQRTAARRLVRARTRRALTAEQRAVDPLSHGRRRFWTRPAEVLCALLMAAAIHVGVVAGTAFIAGREPVRPRKIEQTIRVEVREPAAPPPPRIEKSTVRSPEPRPRAKRIDQPQLQKALPQSAAEPPKKPPVRVVGLSLESTTAGGNGPAFAVGDTRVGQTADRAASPHAGEAGAAGDVAVPRNRAATRIPAEGVKYTSPKMKRKIEPIYPEMLKAQGLEADVTVLVSIGAGGEVIDVEIVKGSPYPEFNQAARATALKQEFEPELRDGVAIPSTLSWVYRFRLEGQ
jgi:periplasmic protein TonB